MITQNDLISKHKKYKTYSYDADVDAVIRDDLFEVYDDRFKLCFFSSKLRTSVSISYQKKHKMDGIKISLT